MNLVLAISIVFLVCSRVVYQFILYVANCVDTIITNISASDIYMIWLDRMKSPSSILSI